MKKNEYFKVKIGNSLKSKKTSKEFLITNIVVEEYNNGKWMNETEYNDLETAVNYKTDNKTVIRIKFEGKSIRLSTLKDYEIIGE